MFIYITFNRTENKNITVLNIILMGVTTIYYKTRRRRQRTFLF